MITNCAVLHFPVASSTRRRNSPDRRHDQQNFSSQSAGISHKRTNSEGSSGSDVDEPRSTRSQDGRSRSQDGRSCSGSRSGSQNSSPLRTRGTQAVSSLPIIRGGTLIQCECKNEEVRFFCCDCSKMVCGECMSAEHKTHSVLRLEDHANKERDLAVATVHSAKKDIADLVEAQSDLQKYKKTLRKSRDEARSGVKNQAEFLRNCIDEFESAMLKDIDNVFADESGNADKLIKHYKEMNLQMKNFTDFATKFLKNASHSEIIAWRNHLELQHKDIHGDIKMSGVDLVRKQPVYIRHVTEFDSTGNNYCKNSLHKLIGKIQFGRHIEIVDLNMNQGASSQTSGMESQEADSKTQDSGKNSTPDERILTNRIHSGRLIQSFSTFTDGSKVPPLLSGLTVLPDGNIVIVDRNNKSVKFFTPLGGMPCKIHGSESLWDVAVLPDGNLVITDKTVHMFDQRGRMVKVLR